ncbi:hypothetical protein EX30DRAFT_91561 [Ascodesmis nigricans]|uniref:C2H2-type domain-containing protein n=1 Tax=Ascodesmis nigricans TaxID=341454 RepID=A0A4S2N3L9_9PEZI|nr:hypothetical protein EX30DRAFT_91561 [Ascodesmis nigricans]
MEGGGGNDGADTGSDATMSRQPSQAGNAMPAAEVLAPETQMEVKAEDQETPTTVNTSSTMSGDTDTTPATTGEEMDLDEKTPVTSPEEQFGAVVAATAAVTETGSNGIAIDPSLDGMDIVGSTSDTAASLISLAGGASKMLDGFTMNYESYGEPPSSTNTLRSDGPHTTLPPLGSIGVLADLATQEGSSPQQQQNQGIGSSPQLATSPSGQSFNSSDGNRPPSHNLGLQAQGHFMNLDQSSPYYQPQTQHYPPIKDPQTTSGASPEPAFAMIPGLVAAAGGATAPTPNSANLFAQGYSMSTPIKQEHQTELYGLDQISLATQAVSQISTPAGPSTGDSITSGSIDESKVRTPGRRSRGGSNVPPGGGFRCDYLGCKAAPFQTQYLLNSHANVHSQERPHYCPVPDCPRGITGKGFKRKNEMIRHGLVHDSPGYICPFCPQREHKYPRPDNLQRHVRVHHMDKDKDDPLLREVLSQRPEGGNRGRRRRAVGSAGPA